VIFVQEDEFPYDQTLPSCVIEEVQWTYLSDKLTRRKMDPRTIFYASRPVRLTQALRLQNLRPTDPELIHLHKGIALACDKWEVNVKP
jgi:hypothetical protein